LKHATQSTSASRPVVSPGLRVGSGLKQAHIGSTANPHGYLPAFGSGAD